MGYSAIGFTIYPGSEYALEQMGELRVLAARVRHVVQRCFDGRRIVVFSGGEFGSDKNALFDGIRSLRDGGADGSIIGGNTSQRLKKQAAQMLDTTIEIDRGEA